ncbi:bifunctional salicylyl-CoA 5-hydroxylase/oxidoreductase [Aggregicoccus sp. 17bor-14]|uniref:bifunctional salicylyl-CoA 5-hydroxylase/oxidoreductase n=1 Tax=Myxococcaceae TaxID=31 RepID=UPI00129C6FB3|nr:MULTISPECIES: bifunctional salicylyl-CoA 5-hydroxylase/oxidoreductase [Myxococcaceae]MBF5042115.1 bifunctional salicylyl-CoA 5-hydroxylase/oxidoreductase [Simulacricoccus sp. 17bor-14]MRI87892.1 bifunctional salicylyl-CoA 5-hydroxylase/oxidoreductase [Aggregicoccus sp. 17bor-14]
MKILCIGGGPAGLYFSILMKRADPSHDITVLERNPPEQTFGWGVVFSDETLGNLLEADPETGRAITETFAHWDAIDVKYKGETLRSTGHGFSGISRRSFLGLLQARAAELGVRLRFSTEVEALPDLAGYDLVVGADGVRSRVRAAFQDTFKPDLDLRRCRYIWLGTKKRFDAFTFAFEETPHGIFQAHAYRFEEGLSTFIVECDEGTWRRADFDTKPPEEAVKELERVFAPHLDGQGLMMNKVGWIQFVTVKCETWHAGNVVLLGDAAHTAHFSIGSGTKLALEDSIALAAALKEHPGSVSEALVAYEEARRPVVGRTQKAAQDSLLWFENVRRYWHMAPLQFAFSLLTRSLRIGWENLRTRDPAFVARVQGWFAGGQEPAPPPMFTPFRLRDMELKNRVVVSPMCMYSATDGTVDEFHLVHLGARALGGAGLIVTEMTDVSAEGRITPGCAGMYSDAHVAAWKRVVDFVHSRSPAKVCLQLGHAGRKGSTEVPWRGDDVPLPPEHGGWECLAPSAIPYAPQLPAPREMDRADMERVREQFAQATRRALAAGFDMVEVHMAHGYLLSSFLTPLANRRRDAYGGSLENRMRFPLEVLAAVREAWPAHKPLSVRISATDWAPGGLDGDDAVVLSRALKAGGADIVHVSTGQTVAEAKPIYGRMWQTRFADQVRNEAQVPTIAVGNITTGDQVNSILAAGRADLVALARPHLSDPNWTQREAAMQEFDAHFWPDPYLAARPRRRKA